MATNELHVVYGTGPLGMALIEELLVQGKRVRVVRRRANRAGLPAAVEVVEGDATDPASTRKASASATHVYNATNPPDYHKWPEQFPPLQRGVLEGAAANDARLIVVENLYMYGPNGGQPFSETTPMRGTGMRSRTRMAMAQELLAAHQSGKVRAVSARPSDLIGPRVRQSLLGEDVFGPLLAGKPVRMLANLDVPHSLSYSRDVARALVTLGAHDDAFGQAWHVPNAPAVTLRTLLIQIFAEAGLDPQFSSLPRALVRLLLPALALVKPQVRGLEENLYIPYEPYVVDHSKYARRFGDHATPLSEVVRETVRWYREQATSLQPTQSTTVA